MNVDARFDKIKKIQNVTDGHTDAHTDGWTSLRGV